MLPQDHNMNDNKSDNNTESSTTLIVF